MGPQNRLFALHLERLPISWASQEPLKSLLKSDPAQCTLQSLQNGATWLPGLSKWTQNGPQNRCEPKQFTDFLKMLILKTVTWKSLIFRCWIG